MTDGRKKGGSFERETAGRNQELQSDMSAKTRRFLVRIERKLSERATPTCQRQGEVTVQYFESSKEPIRKEREKSRN